MENKLLACLQFHYTLVDFHGGCRESSNSSDDDRGERVWKYQWAPSIIYGMGVLMTPNLPSRLQSQ